MIKTAGINNSMIKTAKNNIQTLWTSAYVAMCT